MRTVISRLTSKGQATIPKAVRKELRIGAGDQISFELRDGRVEIRRVEPLDVAFAKAQESSLEAEWSTAEDQAAYGKL